MKAWSLFSVALVAAMLVGCGGSSSKSTPSSGPTATSSPSSTPATSTPSSTGAAIQATMKNLAFIPPLIHAKIGQAIVWTNDDSPPHNVTYVSGPKFTSSPSMMNTGAKFTLKLTTAGTIHYYCTIHPFMKGTIVVAK